MADPRFFRNAGPQSLDVIIAASGATLASGRSAPGPENVEDVRPLQEAGPEHLSFIDNRKYLSEFSASRAGAIFVKPEFAELGPETAALLLTPDPYRAYAKVAWLFYPRPAPEPRISPNADVADGAVLDVTSRVESGAVIGEGAKVGPRTVVGANTVIGPGVEVGEDCLIGPNVSLACCLIEDRVTLHPGVRIGQDGFGFALGADGHFKVPQLGRVRIEHDVEIGANSTIDRGTAPDTVIGAGTKIDNLVQIGHNVHLGRGCIVVSQVGISGSTVVEDFVMIGGQAGFVGHIRIGKGARIGAQAGVIKDVPPGTTVAGYPARPRGEWLRQLATVAKLTKDGGK